MGASSFVGRREILKTGVALLLPVRAIAGQDAAREPLLEAAGRLVED